MQQSFLAGDFSFLSKIMITKREKEQGYKLPPPLELTLINKESFQPFLSSTHSIPALSV
jgi:hypothetical protein